MPYTKIPPDASVLITGASTGIGRACAEHLDKMGLRVFAGVRRAEDGEALVAGISERVTPVHLDVTKPDDIAAAVAQVSEAVGETGLHGLVNNAGIAVAGPLECLPIEELRRQLEINVVALVAVTQAFLPLVRTAGGRVVNMGSTSGFLSLPLLGAYGASKYAVEAVTDSMRLELRPWGIHVAVIQPGAIATPIWDKSQGLAETIAERCPQDRLELYAQDIEEMRRQGQKAAGDASPPEVVAKRVAHALTARRPKTRYRMGKTAQLQYFAAHLPDRLRDALVLAGMRV